VQNWKPFSKDKNNRILVIDDNPQIHTDFRNILCAELDTIVLDRKEAVLFDESAKFSHGAPAEAFEVDSAYQGQQGLELVERALAEGRPYAMAFVDVRMPPGWDGVETISQIWRKYPSLQVVICTAYSDYSWEEIARNLGAPDNLVILKKPFDNIEVLQLAHAMTKKWMVTLQANTRMEDLNRMVRERTEKLEAANERFGKAFKASPLPIAICKISNASFLDVNESFLELFALQRKSVIGHTEDDLRIWADPGDRQRFWDSVRSNHSVRDMRLRLRVKDDDVREVAAFAEGFQLEREHCLLVVFHDVTDRLKLEEQLRQSQKLEAVGQLAAGVAHDFNNLLTVIRGHAELRLGTPALDEGLSESLKQIARASERAASLTRQLLAFSRRHIMHLAALDLNDLIRSMQDMIRSVLGEDVELHCELASRLPPICADRWSLEQVMVNLVVNARDAMPQGGRLSVRTYTVEVDAREAGLNPEAHPGSFVCLTVEDTGCGMDADTLNRVFEPFFTTKPVGKGTGMGMAMAYGIVKQHEGWIRVHSRVGCGTIFQIYLPMSEKPIEPRPEPTLPPELPRGTETVLMVEDDPALLAMGRNVLHAAGYKVFHASSGNEAMKVWSVNRDKIDLLFSDIVMPEGLDGRKLAEKLKAEKPGLKVLLTTGHHYKLKEQTSALNTALFISKPFSAGALLRTVRLCLDRPIENGQPVEVH